MAKKRPYKETKALVKERSKLMTEAGSNQQLAQQLMGRKLNWENLRETAASIQKWKDLLAVNDEWKTRIDANVEQFLATKGKNYTEGQKRFVRNYNVIEEALGDDIERIKTLYGSDDFGELAGMVYLELEKGTTDEEIAALSDAFEQTHGLRLNIEKFQNPFKGINWEGGGQF